MEKRETDSGSGAADHEVARPVGPEPQSEEPPIVDLDADELPVVDLDEDGDADGLVAALLAETLAVEHPDADEPEPPLIDLDGELEAVETEQAPSAPAHQAGPATPATPDTEASRAGAAEPPAAVGEPTGKGAAAHTGELSAEEAVRRLIQLGTVSSPEIRDRLLAEALAHAEHKEARYRVPLSETPTVGRWKILAGFLILLAAGSVALAPPEWATPEPPARLTASEVGRGLRVALLLQAEQVEAFRVREQRLPTTLEEVAGALPGVRYVRSGTRAYQLVAYMPDGSAVVYDSVSPAAAFEAVELGWRSKEGAP